MSYSVTERSQSRAKPRELYKFEGTYGNYYYTSQQEDVVYDDGDGRGPQTYEAYSMKRTGIKIGTHEDDGLDITVELPVRLQVVQDYAFQISPPKLRLTIYRYHTLADVRTSWVGPVSGIRLSKGVASIKSPSILSNALSGSCPSVYYQTPCNRILFDEGCKVDRAANSVEAAIVAISESGTTITLSTIGSKPAGFFRAGELLLPSGERRMVIDQSGTSVLINFPFSRVTKHQRCELTAGCDHAYNGDCLNKFDNQVQFGGFMFIPNINPFSNGLD